MSADTIDHTTLAQLVEAGAIRATYVIGQAGGWGVVVKYGRTMRPLAATRSRQIRIFKKLETLVGYLKDLGIASFDVDAANYDPATLKTYSRPDRADALRHAHESAAHDRWFRAQVAEGISEADDPDTEWVSHEEAKASWARKRTALAKRAKATTA